MKTGYRIHGFRVLSTRDLPEYRCSAAYLAHERTGLEVFNLSTEDRENLFAFSFTTPPPDDTGVTHIAEHCVLSGSKMFPLKEPFSVLMKGSMHTFLNAFTFPDRTVYPASSLSPSDFFNLMLVYGDAVFSPLLRKETFMQEAWRLEGRQADGARREGQAGGGALGDVRYAGIVYNEMKGAYSSPDSVVTEWAYRSLFPDTPYRLDSGGDPTHIPSLSLEALRAYHARYYSPSNCRVFLYGNIEIGEKLGFLQERLLGRFDRGFRAEPLPLQKRWDRERRLEKTFPVKAESPSQGRSTVCMSWLSRPVTDPFDVLSLEVLEEILIGSAGSPLRKSLVDSGLGEDLSPASGLETELRQAVFCVGLRGTESDRERAIRELVLDTLSSLHSAGIDPVTTEAMINRVEFRNREIRGGGSPYALRLLRRTLRGWTHGMDPAESLAFTPVMDALKERRQKNSRYFEDLIEEELLSNPHRVNLVVKPDPEQEGREARELESRLSSVIGAMDGAEKKGVAAEAEAFLAYQRKPDSQEDIARVPSLSRKDLPKTVEVIPTAEETISGTVPLFLHDIFTNRIAYVDFLFPLEGLDEGLAFLLPLFSKAVCECGVPGVSYADVAVQLFRLTGGFFSSLDAGAIVGEPEKTLQYVYFRLKTLWSNLGPALDLVRSLLVSADFRDTARMRDLIREMRNDLKAAFIPGAHQFAALRAASRLCPSATREEKWKGVDQLFFLEDLVSHLDERLDEVVSSLEVIRSSIVSREGLIVNATVSGDCFQELAAALGDFCGTLPGKPSAGSAGSRGVSRPSSPSGIGKGAQSLVTSASVGYVARAIRGFRYEEPGSAAQTVLGHLLSTGFLWENVRMEGGAYGAFSYPRSMDGVFVFGSYRDPHIVRTLGAFRTALSIAAEGKVEESDIDRAVIGVVGKEEKPMDPGEKGLVGLKRRLCGVSDELRLSHRLRVLAMDRRQIADASRRLLDTFPDGYSVVVSSRAEVEKAGREMPELATDVRDIPE